MKEYTHLNASEGDQLALLRARGLGIRASAREMGRSPSTISRELRRNAARNEFYRPDLAARRYLRRRCRDAILEKDERLRTYVIARLSEGWSPEQISGRLGKRIEKGLGRVCHETIYAFIYRKRQEAQELWRYLVRRRAKRRPLAARPSRDGIKNKVHVGERPDTANTRKEAGHWEADLVICKHARPLLFLHERKTRLTLMASMLGKTAGETVAKLQAILKRLAPTMRGSITFDKPRQQAAAPILQGPGSGDPGGAPSLLNTRCCAACLGTRHISVMPMHPGKKAVLRTPMAEYGDGCLGGPISMNSPRRIFKTWR